MIYLISTGSHRDSIDLGYYFTNEEQIENWIKKYRRYYFGETVKNIKVNLKDLKVTFEYCDYGEDYESTTYYLFKLNQYE